MQEAPNQPNARSPTCPRCGYDLSGEVATWASACPVEGRCTECGLGFLWRDVLHPDYTVSRGSLEHEPSWLLAATRAWAVTLLRLLLPWRFWRHVRMGQPVVWHRLCVGALLSIVALHLSVVGFTLLWQLMSHHQDILFAAANPAVLNNVTPQWASLTVDVLLWPYDNLHDLGWYAGGSTLPGFGWGWFWPEDLGDLGLAVLLLISALFAVIGPTIIRITKKYQARWSHLIRAWWYSAAMLVTFGAVRFVLDVINRILVERAFLLGFGGHHNTWYTPIYDTLGALQTQIAFVHRWSWAICIAWITTFWWFVFRRYLREPRWTYGFALLVVLVAIVFALLLILLGYPVDEWILGNPMDAVP